MKLPFSLSCPRLRWRHLGYTLVAIALVTISAVIYNTGMSRTRIAFVNFPNLQMGHIAKADDYTMISLKSLSAENIEQIENCDMVFIAGMGLKITEEQRAKVEQLAAQGLPILTVMTTNPANNFITISGEQADSLRGYLLYGGRENYRNLFHYVRKYIDGKWFMAPEPKVAVKQKSALLYHRHPTQPEAEELVFNSVREYEDFLKKNKIWTPQAKQFIITGIMGQPYDLADEFERQGHRIYHVDNLRDFIAKGHADSLKLSGVINLAHGRLGDEIVAYLKVKNIPLFGSVYTLSKREDWEKSAMGMSGGFLGQTITMPEIDGAILPYAVFAQREDKEGLLQDYAMPDRVRDFVQTIGNYAALRSKANKNKRLAIFYYKGPGQGALVAQGMEVVPSLYNTLKRLQKEGYNVGKLPPSHQALEKLLQVHGLVLGEYAKGKFDEFLSKGKPALISKTDYEKWIKASIAPEKYQEVVKACGDFPGQYLATKDGQLGVPRLQLGNVVLMPQMAAGAGSDLFKIAHGTDAAPPHVYIASYLWAKNAFKADALIHFGTHGSLEYTPNKQVALSQLDWPDRLVGTMPHFYIYTIANVGEAMIAKRRSYATIQSYLTPPFLESGLRKDMRELEQKFNSYNALQLKQEVHDQQNGGTVQTSNQAALDRIAKEAKTIAVRMGLHRALGLDSILSRPYNEDEMVRLENFAEEIASEKITGQYYIMGQAYEPARIQSTVYAMATEPIAYSRLALDKLRKKATSDAERHNTIFTARYLKPAQELVARLYHNPAQATDQLICQVAGITAAELAKAREIDEATRIPPGGIMAMMMTMAGGQNMIAAEKGKGGKQGKQPSPEHLKMMRTMAAMGFKPPKHVMERIKQREAEAKKAQKEKPRGMPQSVMQSGMGVADMKFKTYSKQEKLLAQAIMEVERTIKNVNNYREQLLQSPELEFQTLLNSLNGGFTMPQPGGDPIANPNALPTGRNMYSINAEATPSEAAWEKGKQLVKNTLDTYRRRHNDSIPRKVSYTFWSGEFLETEGATLAQALYMLGVEPIRDVFGRVNDLRLIPSKELGRPRIDVVVQTSGQLRDLAASRLFLLQRAVDMAANAKDEAFANEVKAGVVESERKLIEKGVSPKRARELAARRIFGGINGNFGTGIQEMVMASDKYDNEKQVAEVYLNNMGAYYGEEKKWEEFENHAFEAALTRTDLVIQPRQNNTWGALSLDHVFEFMGGINLTVRNVTGKDPDAYLSDYRNRNKVRIQEVKEAIGVESQTTLFNPTFIKEQMKGEASSAANLEELVRNTFGWEVMKPEAIDEEMWNEIHEVYIRDKHHLNIRQYFEEKSPAALQGITAMMLESARKGMWKATAQQIKELATLHTELVQEHKAACTQFVCNNTALQKFVAEKVDGQAASAYQAAIADVREGKSQDGQVLKKEETSLTPEMSSKQVTTTLVIAFVGAALLGVVVFVLKRRKK